MSYLIYNGEKYGGDIIRSAQADWNETDVTSDAFIKNKPDVDDFMTKSNPTGTGSLSMNRKAGTAIGVNSTAEGTQCTAVGAGSHAEGTITIAAGVNAHAEGMDTKALGNYSHTEGNGTVANTDAAHAEGIDTIADDTGAHAEGLGTIASAAYSHAQGKYNIEDVNETYAHIVGNGTSDTKRSNAHTLDWDGNAWFAGGVTVGTDKDRLAKFSEIPTSLPANGGNSDTVDGIHISCTKDGQAINWLAAFVSPNDLHAIAPGEVSVGNADTVDGKHASDFIQTSGGSMSGALNFANATWNNVGDDVMIGDRNIAGTLAVKGLTGQTNIELFDWQTGNSLGTVDLCQYPGQVTDTRIEMPDGVDMCSWLRTNAASGKLYFTVGLGSRTNAPKYLTDHPYQWTWINYDKNRYIARVMVDDWHTKDYIMDAVNYVGGWKEITFDSVPIKSTIVQTTTSSDTAIINLWDASESRKVVFIENDPSLPGIKCIPVISEKNGIHYQGVYAIAFNYATGEFVPAKSKSLKIIVYYVNN